MADHIRNEVTRKERGITSRPISKIIKRLSNETALEKCLKTEFRNCSINMNQRAEDVRDVRQKDEWNLLILITGTEKYDCPRGITPVNPAVGWLKNDRDGWP
jgi:hypothetical protein